MSRRAKETLLLWVFAVPLIATVAVRSGLLIAGGILVFALVMGTLLTAHQMGWDPRNRRVVREIERNRKR